MIELNFYYIDDVITKSLAPLLIKALDDKKKAIVFCKNAAKLKEIDDSLWTYGKYRFIPHITMQEKEIIEEFGIERQPILLIDKEENKNDAELLVLVDEASVEFVKKFKRVFYFYDSTMKDSAEAIKSNLSSISSKINSYKKEDGKWVKS